MSDSPPTLSPGRKGPRETQALWAWWGDFSLRHDRAILLVMAATTLCFAAAATKTRIGSDSNGFRSDGQIALIEDIEKLFKDPNLHHIIFEANGSKSLFEPELLRQQLAALQALEENFDIEITCFVKGLEEGLRRVKNTSLQQVTDYSTIGDSLLAVADSRSAVDFGKLGINSVDPSSVVEFYTNLRVTLMSTGATGSGSEFLHEVPYVNALGATIEFGPKTTEQERRALIVRMRELTDGMQTQDLLIHHFSTVLTVVDIDSQVRKGAHWAVLTLLVFDALMILAILRTWREVALIMSQVCVTVFWVLGAAALMGWKMNLANAMIFPALFGTGFDDCTVFATRLRAFQKEGYPFYEALRKTMGSVGNAMFLTTFTTGSGFAAAAMFAQSPTVREFCLLFSIAMVVDLVVTFLLQIPIRSALHRHRRAAEQTAPPLRGAAVTHWPGEAAARLLGLRPKLILILAAGGCIVCTALSSQLRADYDSDDYISRGTPSWRAYSAYQSRFGAPRAGYVLIEGDIEQPIVLERMQKLLGLMKELPLVRKVMGQPDVDSVLYYMDKLPRRLRAKGTPHELFEYITTSKRRANIVTDERFYEVGPDWVHQQNGKYDALLMRFFLADRDGRKSRLLASQVGEELERAGLTSIPDVHTRLGAGLVGWGLDMVRYALAGLQASAISLLVTFLALALSWASLRRAAMGCAPVVLGVLVVGAVAVVLGLHVDAVNFLVAAIAVGLGIDYPIHVIERYYEGLREAADPASFGQKVGAAQTAARDSAAVLFGSAVTSSLGFAATTTLRVPAMSNMGLLVALAIVVTYVISITVLPALLIFAGGRSS